nr:zinc finger BED domain-containing protein RICESLEEPER 4-like [Aegilops tauschii subsp. strangulata]
MLKAAASYEKVFARYADEDPYYAIDLLSDKGKDKGPGVREEQYWENVNKLAEFLAHFGDLTIRVSASLHVTAHSSFHEISEVNILMKKWMDGGDGLKIAMAERMKEMYDKYRGNWHEPDPNKKGKEKDNMNLLIFIATALDPRYKLAEYTHLAILEMYGDDKGPKVWPAINTCLRDLFEEHRVMYALENVLPQTTREAESASGGHTSMMKSLIAKKMR